MTGIWYLVVFEGVAGFITKGGRILCIARRARYIR